MELDYCRELAKQHQMLQEEVMTWAALAAEGDFHRFFLWENHGQTMGFPMGLKMVISWDFPWDFPMGIFLLVLSADQTVRNDGHSLMGRLPGLVNVCRLRTGTCGTWP